ncbi:MAG: UDP-3-O-[3-hydroxymyristoyl] N-acetylglucosamine deacetylase [Firmicutes bacterium]|nr:UDP-3-O-[3-hydroxymyristoyl] N-acetylglucosamine deacetylase [Bacillota bacterium]
MQEQQTLRKSVTLSGMGLHSGTAVHMRLLPASVNTGIIFRRMDLPGQPEIPAAVESIASTNRNTSLSRGTAQVMTVEHLMAALRGLGVDNAIIELDGGEPPMGDGSAQIFVEMIQEAGLSAQGTRRHFCQLNTPVWVSQGDSHLVAVPADEFTVSYTFVSDHPQVGTQYGEFAITEDVFLQELAPARTLIFAKDIEALRRQGLGLGGNLDSVVIIGDNGYHNSLRYQDEVVRHKILDIVGDLGLLGFLQAHVIGVRSGHSLNRQLMLEIWEQAYSAMGVGNR